MKIFLFLITISNITQILGSSDIPLPSLENMAQKRKLSETTSDESSSDSESINSNGMPTQQEISELFSKKRVKITDFTTQELLFSVEWEKLHEMYNIFASNAGLSTHMRPIEFPLPKNEPAASAIEFLYTKYGFKEYSYEWMFASYAYTALMGEIPSPELKIHNNILEQAARYSGRAASFLSLLFKNNLGKKPTYPYSDIEMYRHSYSYFAALRARKYGISAAWNIIARTGYDMTEPCL